jgi:hypothetical protein
VQRHAQGCAWLQGFSRPGCVANVRVDSSSLFARSKDKAPLGSAKGGFTLGWAGRFAPSPTPRALASLASLAPLFFGPSAAADGAVQAASPLALSRERRAGSLRSLRPSNERSLRSRPWSRCLLAHPLTRMELCKRRSRLPCPGSVVRAASLLRPPQRIGQAGQGHLAAHVEGCRRLSDPAAGGRRARPALFPA